MLVLQRQEDQALLLSYGIRISVVEIKNGKVKLGIEAPGTCAIWREELVKPGQPLPASNAKAA